MLTVDRSAMNIENRNLPLAPLLADFAIQVSLAKPLCEFSTTDSCVRTNYNYKTTPTTSTKEIYKIEVRQDGELLGGLYIGERYANGMKEGVYGVESFRIRKERGANNATVTKNSKVALRNAKKAFVSRADDELRELIKGQVTANMNSVWNTARNAITYTMDCSAEALGIAMLAYEARKRGDATFTAPAMPTTIKRVKEHEKECENYVVSTFLNDQLKGGQGYGVSVYSNGSLAVLSFADMSINKFKGFDAVPNDIQSKLAMFKVIGVNEPYTHLGCKFTAEMFYIVAGDMNLES